MIRFRRVLLLPVLLVFYTGCSIGSVMVDVKPDGSGTLEVRTLNVGEVDQLPDVKGASTKQNTRYTIERMKFEFKDLSAMSMDDLSFNFQKGDEKTEISMTVPTTRESGWVKQMQLNEERMERLKKRFKKMTDRMGERRALVNLDPKDALKVKFQINAPAEIMDYEIDAPDLKDHEWVSEKNARNDSPGANQLVIDVPVRAVFREELKNVSVRITCASKQTGNGEDGEDDGSGESDDEIKTY